jgi:hypothetical protein
MSTIAWSCDASLYSAIELRGGLIVEELQASRHHILFEAEVLAG